VVVAAASRAFSLTRPALVCGSRCMSARAATKRSRSFA
jgi:hypothetical protein